MLPREKASTALKPKQSGGISRISREESLTNMDSARLANNKAVSIKFPETDSPLDQPILGGTARVKAGMSTAVQAANDDLHEAERQMKDLEKKRIERMKDLEEFDCAEMLKTAGVKIKVMNQLLDRLIPSDDSHTVIVENKAYGIEVIPGNLMTFRVPVKNACPPMRFNITYND